MWEFSLHLLIVQSLANPDFVDEGLWKRLIKVFFVAILNGLVLSVLVFGANVLLFGEYRLSMVVSLALFSVVVFASFIGTITPLIFNRFGFNPAFAAGPFITTMNDLLGLTVYFFTVHLIALDVNDQNALSLIRCMKVCLPCCKKLDGSQTINQTITREAIKAST